MEYTIVGTAESDPLNNKISNESPVGKAIIGKKKGHDSRSERSCGYHSIQNRRYQDVISDLRIADIESNGASIRDRRWNLRSVSRGKLPTEAFLPVNRRIVRRHMKETYTMEHEESTGNAEISELLQIRRNKLDELRELWASIRSA